MLAKTADIVSPTPPQGTRGRLLEAALREVRRNGFRATSVNDILASTGLTKGAFYHYFPSKRALGVAIIDEVLLANVDAVWVRPLRDAPRPFEALTALLAAAEADAESLLLGHLADELADVDEVLRERLQRVYDRWITALADALTRAQTQGHVTARVDTRDTAAFVVAALAGSHVLARTARSGATLVRCRDQLLCYLDCIRA